MNGYDAARIIRNQSADVPIIALTADVILGVKEQCAENGIYHYISKPFDPDKFLETIKNIISKSPLPNMDDNAILDARMGLMNMGNNVSLYQQILEIYLSENQNTTFALTQAIGEKRYDEAALLIHKMKSSSGSIGAKSLYELAKKLQKALENNNEDEINYLFKDFKHQLKKLLEEITDYRTMDHQYQY
jgi:HPt (histidine-containing phosphotransfer) domain-containing protein